MLSVAEGIRELLSGVVLAQSLSAGCSQDVGQGCGHLKACLGLEDPLLCWLTLLLGKLVLAVGRRPSRLTTRTSS